MVRRDIEVTNIHTDNEGRILIFDAAECTWAPGTRSKEIKKQNIGRLNILKLRQINLTHKVNKGQIELLAELKTVNISISEWYNNESDKIILLSRSNDLNSNEKVRVYHHGQHLQFRKRSSILQLQTPTGIVNNIKTVQKHSKTMYSIT